jgi:hypothetical protein
MKNLDLSPNFEQVMLQYYHQQVAAKMSASKLRSSVRKIQPNNVCLEESSRMEESAHIETPRFNAVNTEQWSRFKILKEFIEH